MAKDKREKSEKSQIVAFKVDDDLANFLDNLPNKSEFIRRAILAQFNYGANGLELYPLEDEERVDEWRAEVGLGTMAEYEERMRAQN